MTFLIQVCYKLNLECMYINMYTELNKNRIKTKFSDYLVVFYLK